MTDAEIKDTYDFPRAYQVKLIALMFRKQGFVRANRKWLNPDFFQDPLLSILCAHGVEWFDKFHASPTIDAMEACISDRVTRETKVIEEAGKRARKVKELWKEWGELLEELKTTSLAEASDITERIRDFAQRSAVRLALYLGISDYQKGNYHKAQERLTKALTVGRDESDFGLDYIQDTTRFRYERADHCIPTGLPRFDEALGGGPGMRESALLVGYYNRGKSTALANFAAHALKRGKRVVYYSFENPRQDIARKIDRIMCATLKDIPLSAIKGEIREKLIEYNKAWKGNLIIEDAAPGSVSCPEYMAYLRMLQDMGKFAQKPGDSLLITDYGAKFRPEFRRDRKDLEIREFYQSLIQAYREFECAGWSAAQLEGSKRFKENCGMQDLGECKAVAADADIVAIMNQTQEEYKHRRIRMFVDKSRFTPACRTFPMQFDFEMHTLTEISANGGVRKRTGTNA